MSQNLELGKAGELRIASELLIRGHRASLSLVDSGIDMILDTGIKIQVKTARRHVILCKDGKGRPRYFFNCQHQNKPRISSLKNADFLILWCVEDDEFFIIPTNIIEKKTNIAISCLGGPNTSIGKKYLEYKNKWNLLQANGGK